MQKQINKKHDLDFALNNRIQRLLLDIFLYYIPNHCNFLRVYHGNIVNLLQFEGLTTKNVIFNNAILITHSTPNDGQFLRRDFKVPTSVWCHYNIVSNPVQLENPDWERLMEVSCC